MITYRLFIEFLNLIYTEILKLPVNKQKPVNEKGDENMKHEQSCLTSRCLTLGFKKWSYSSLGTPPFFKTRSQCEGGFPVQVSDKAGSCNSLTMNV